MSFRIEMYKKPETRLGPCKSPKPRPMLHQKVEMHKKTGSRDPIEKTRNRFSPKPVLAYPVRVSPDPVLRTGSLHPCQTSSETGSPDPVLDPLSRRFFMANPSGVSSVGQSSMGENLEVSKVIETKRNKEVWDHFDLCLMTNQMKKARCKHCKRFFGADSNTSLAKHIRKACPIFHSAPDSTQTNITPQGGVFTYNNDALREQFTKFVIRKALPFDHFDDQDFTAVIQSYMQPGYTQVSRTTLRRDALKMWHMAREKMVLGFQEHRYGVSLTCDVWTSPHGTGYSYLAVTAHWMNQENWQMMKRTIAFELFGGSHTGNNLFTLLKKVIEHYQLRNKIFAMSFDNASNNTSAVPKLKLLLNPILDGKFFHTRCVAHIINLSVQDGLEVINDVRVEFKEMIKFVFCNNTTRQGKYRKYCKSVGKPYLGPNLDCPTRWNSTWMMMHSALRQRDTLQPFHDGLAEKKKTTKFSNAKWDIIAKLTELLKVFKDATTSLSGVYYPTSPLVLSRILDMGKKLNDFEYHGKLFENVGKEMKVKLLKYFREIPPVFTCAAALKPNVKCLWG
ncbi:hypothetical protein OSB04_015731 [Centaurea solstitialis]|uniref:BED-type domain-containing protein n=1 Tax=Centaurea solstitialis TaxID=347529 RepID=A0AA38TCX3_9ASTR|nr:hypothetical protein OSB04_015731 [Centaurea solstitialis]